MNLDDRTTKKQGIVCICSDTDTGVCSRKEIMRMLAETQKHIEADEVELHALVESALSKLSRMSDAELQRARP